MISFSFKKILLAISVLFFAIPFFASAQLVSSGEAMAFPAFGGNPGLCVISYNDSGGEYYGAASAWGLTSTWPDPMGTTIEPTLNSFGLLEDVIYSSDLQPNTLYTIQIIEDFEGEYYPIQGPNGPLLASTCTSNADGTFGSCMFNNFPEIADQLDGPTDDCLDLNGNFLPDDVETELDDDPDVVSLVGLESLVLTDGTYTTENSIVLHGQIFNEDGVEVPNIDVEVKAYEHLDGFNCNTQQGAFISSDSQISDFNGEFVADIGGLEAFTQYCVEVDSSFGSLIGFGGPFVSFFTQEAGSDDGDNDDGDDTGFGGENYQNALDDIEDGIVPCGNDNPEECDFNDLMELIDRVINTLLFLVALPLAAIVFAIAGFRLIVSGGNPGVRSQVKDMMKKVVLGLIIALAAWLLVKLVLVTLGYEGELFNILGLSD